VLERYFGKKGIRRAQKSMRTGQLRPLAFGFDSGRCGSFVKETTPIAHCTHTVSSCEWLSPLAHPPVGWDTQSCLPDSFGRILLRVLIPLSAGDPL
jgi:hypothetical protein